MNKFRNIYAIIDTYIPDTQRVYCHILQNYYYFFVINKSSNNNLKKSIKLKEYLKKKTYVVML